MKEINGKAICRMGCCGVFAVAYVAGKPIEEVFELIKKRYRKGNRWQGATSSKVREGMLKYFGVRFKPVHKVIRIAYRDGIKASYAGTDLTGSGTLATWVDLHTVRGVTYIVENCDHVMVICDGIMHDQNRSGPISDYRRKRSRVESALQIISN
jgi:hypothetical protein